MFQPSHPPPLVPLVSEEKKLISISVDNLLSSLRLCEAELPLGWERYVFCLNPAEFTEFEQLLGHDKLLKEYYVDKVQYDWEPPTKASRKGRYILRMSSGCTSDSCAKYRMRLHWASNNLGGIVGTSRSSSSLRANGIAGPG